MNLISILSCIYIVSWCSFLLFHILFVKTPEEIEQDKITWLVNRFGDSDEA